MLVEMRKESRGVSRLQELHRGLCFMPGLLLLGLSSLWGSGRNPGRLHSYKHTPRQEPGGE